MTVTNNGPSTAQNVTVTDNWIGGGGFWEFGLRKTPAAVRCTTPLPVDSYARPAHRANDRGQQFGPASAELPCERTERPAVVCH